MPRFQLRIRTLMILVVVASLVLIVWDAVRQDSEGVFLYVGCFCCTPIVVALLALWSLVVILSRRDPPPG